MSVSYLGQYGLNEKPGGGGTVDLWGMDMLTRRYFIKRTDFASSYLRIKKHRRNIADEEFPACHLTGFTWTDDGGYTNITATFKGIITGEIPQLVKDSGYRLQDASLELGGAITLGTLEPTGQTANFSYNAPFTNFRYVTKTKPKAAKFRGQIDYTDDSLEIISKNGAAGNLALLRGKSLAKPTRDSGNFTGTANKYNGVLECVTTQFTVQPAGQWFECMETNEIRLMRLELSNQPRLFQLTGGRSE